MTARHVLGAVAVAILVGACSSGSAPAASSGGVAAGSPSGSSGGTLTIYAAASLKGVLAKVAESYKAAKPGVTLIVSTDSSAALETKIEQGAPADVFLSADTSNPQKLVDKSLASGQIVKFAGNELTLIVPHDNPAGIASAADLAKQGIKVVAAEHNVPITKYAKQLVDNVAKTQGNAAAFTAGYNANIVSKEDNVASVVSKIELGEGDVAIVYVTDAKTSKKVTAIPVPSAVNVTATYGGVIVKGTANQTSAAAFLEWLSGADGQAIFASFGFRAPS